MNGSAIRFEPGWQFELVPKHPRRLVNGEARGVGRQLDQQAVRRAEALRGSQTLRRPQAGVRCIAPALSLAGRRRRSTTLIETRG